MADPADDIVAAEMKKSNTPGVSVAVVRDGKVVKLKGYGFANLEHKVRVTPDTIFQSGSVGKQFTSALVMKLVEDGKLSLNDSLRKHFPDAPEAWSAITVRHLLTHTSGLGNSYSKIDMRKDYTEAELVKFAAEVPPEFKPGEKFSYSNTGYHVLGVLCSKVGGKFYGDQLIERIFRPAGMRTARVITEADLVMNRAAGYEVRKGKIYNQEWVAPALNTTGDGSLYLSVRDMTNWNASLDSDKVLSSDIKRQMWTPARLNDGSKVDYGFGWSLDSYNGYKQIGHGGAWQGFRTAILRFPDHKLAVIVLANSDSCNAEAVARKVAGSYVPALAPKPVVPIKDTVPELTTIITSFFSGDLDKAYAMLGSDLQGKLGKPALKGLFDDVGKRGKVSLLALKETPDGRETTYRIEFANDTAIIVATFDAKNVIVKLSVRPAEETEPG